jgi:hypothetical protein
MLYICITSSNVKLTFELAFICMQYLETRPHQ